MKNENFMVTPSPVRAYRRPVILITFTTEVGRRATRNDVKAPNERSLEDGQSAGGQIFQVPTIPFTFSRTSEPLRKVNASDSRSGNFLAVVNQLSLDRNRIFQRVDGVAPLLDQLQHFL